jgi:hypothetical protein
MYRNSARPKTLVSTGYEVLLMMAVIQDSDGGVLPIMYAVVEGETYETWKWFIELLIEWPPQVHEKWYPITSDRAKGLIRAGSELLPRYPHRHCSIHVTRNIHHRLGTAVASRFSRLVYAVSSEEHDALLEGLARDVPQAGAYLDRNRQRPILKECYSPAYFDGCAFGRTTSNNGRLNHAKFISLLFSLTDALDIVHQLKLQTACT